MLFLLLLLDFFHQHVLKREMQFSNPIEKNQYTVLRDVLEAVQSTHSM